MRCFPINTGEVKLNAWCWEDNWVGLVCSHTRMSLRRFKVKGFTKYTETSIKLSMNYVAHNKRWRVTCTQTKHEKIEFYFLLKHTSIIIIIINVRIYRQQIKCIIKPNTLHNSSVSCFWFIVSALLLSIFYLDSKLCNIWNQISMLL